MRAAVLRQAPGRLEIENVQISKPGPREVLIQTRAAGLCHSDLHFMEAKYPTPLPTVLGHESAGVVEAVGDQVHYVAPGDHVITCLSVYCGDCDACLSGHLSICDRQIDTDRRPGQEPRLRQNGSAINQFARLSSFAEQMLIHEHGLVKIRKDMPFDRAALLGCGVTTGLGAVFNTAKVPPGATVAVIGCGGIGLNIVQGAAIAGARRIFAIDVVKSKLELARKLGATDTINAREVDPIAAIKDLTSGGVQYSFEALGSKPTAEQAFHMLRSGGTATIVGMIPIKDSIEIPGYAFLRERKIQGSLMGSNRFRIDMPLFIDLYLDGRLKLDELVSAHIKLDDINQGFEVMKGGEIARSVIVFDA